MRKLSVCLLMGFILLVSASPAWAQNSNFASGLLDRFISQTDGWWGLLQGYALFLFTVTLTLEVCLMGIRVALNQKNIGEILEQFVMLLLFAGFIAAVIMNYQEWATGIAIKGLKPLAGELTDKKIDAGYPVAMASLLLEKVVLVLSGASLTDIVHVMLYEFVVLIVIIVFVLISALMILITCEFYIVANVGILLIGLGGSKIFKDYAVNVMRYILAVAIKLFVLQLIVNVGFNILTLQDVMNSAGTTIKNIKFVDLFYIIGQAIILLALAKSLPDTCAGIINGSAIGGGNPIASMGKAVGTAAVGAVSAGAGYAVGAAAAAKDSYTIAKSEGATGVMGTAGKMARTMWNANKDASAAGDQKNLESNPGSMKNQLRSKVNALKASQMLGGSDDFSTAPSSNDSPQTSTAPLQNNQATLSTPTGSAADSYSEQSDSQSNSQIEKPSSVGNLASPEAPENTVEPPKNSSKPEPPKKRSGTVDMRNYDPKDI